MSDELRPIGADLNDLDLTCDIPDDAFITGAVVVLEMTRTNATSGQQYAYAKSPGITQAAALGLLNIGLTYLTDYLVEPGEEE